MQPRLAGERIAARRDAGLALAEPRDAEALRVARLDRTEVARRLAIHADAAMVRAAELTSRGDALGGNADELEEELLTDVSVGTDGRVAVVDVGITRIAIAQARHAGVLAA